MAQLVAINRYNLSIQRTATLSNKDCTVSNSPFLARVCPECFIGHLHPQRSTYVVAFGDVLMSIPNTPALKCDICHAVQFDPSVTSALEALIAQEIRLSLIHI